MRALRRYRRVIVRASLKKDAHINANGERVIREEQLRVSAKVGAIMQKEIDYQCKATSIVLWAGTSLLYTLDARRDEKRGDSDFQMAIGNSMK